MKGLHELGFLQSDSKAVTHQSGDLRSTGSADRVANAPFLTLNEKREATGYAPVADGDRLG